MSEKRISWDEGISIVIPTYKRPHGIATALPSVIGQVADGRPIEIIVADNDPAGSAREYVESFSSQSDATIIYVHVPEPGVSNARNGAVAHARGRFIVFLDDDMEAIGDVDGHWLAPLIATAERFDAGIVFGPAIATVPDLTNPVQRYMIPIYSRVRDMEDGLLKKGIATGNCLLDRQRCAFPDPMFDPALNEAGGEDDALFEHLAAGGTKIAYCNAAKTLEHVPATRATLRYIWRRNFSWGQSPSRNAADMGIKGLAKVLFWMMIGTVQLTANGLAFCVLRLLGRPQYVKFFARFSQGVGKVLWSDRLTPKLYGN
ncbi:glycosyltransferase family 2 protein [Litorimonas sp. RW-G-Af-16]|uniref:glycosyltransferase family 2 protein n=1 Tax=Litorimonas sp. RW-G-Af-16 TaxID=3241168 RepID=UPI00390CD52D